MESDRTRLGKVLALAINPGSVEGEAIAAFHRARHLVKRNPALAYPAEQATRVAPRASAAAPAPEATFKISIAGVHPDWVLILIGHLSKTAYELDLKHQIEFDFSRALTGITILCGGPRPACIAFEAQVQWTITYINAEL